MQHTATALCIGTKLPHGEWREQNLRANNCVKFVFNPADPKAAGSATTLVGSQVAAVCAGKEPHR